MISKSFTSKSFGAVAPGFIFTDADAEAYYDALVVANGADIDSVTLYSITLDIFKEGIDDHVIALKAGGVWTTLVHYYPFMGGTAVTHAINMVNGSSELTYVGSPSHSATGMLLNGSTQYANMNNNPSTELTLEDTHLMLLADSPTNTQRGLGSGMSTSQRMWTLVNSNTSAVSDMYNSTTGRIAMLTMNSNNIPIIMSRTSAAFHGLYVDATLQGSTITNGGSLPSVNMYLGAVFNMPNPIYLLGGDVRSGSVGDGLTSGEVTTFNTEIKTINTLLGR